MAMSSTATNLVFGCCTGGFVLCIAGGVTSVQSGSSPLLGVEFGLFIFGDLIAICGCRFIRSNKESQIRDAIAIESRKYSQRTPIPCSMAIKFVMVNIKIVNSIQFIV